MNMGILLGSLFDGIGAFPLSASKYGIKAVWASEIESFPIKVTSLRFPNMKHIGDVTKINGADIEPVDIITFGSPCQDLSVAGKRGGLQGERSGLFSHAVRIIREMRDSTGGQYPRFAVWENVPGAFSSNRGEDFRAVLSEIAETEIPMPRSGKWANAGMVRTERVDVAWRVLDAQYWGVPQRRKRIFLVADFGGRCAAEILFKPEGVSRNLTQSGKARQEAAATVGDGVEEPNCLNPWDSQGHKVMSSDGIAQCLRGGSSNGYPGYRVLAENHINTPHAVAYEVDEQLLFENHSQDTRYVGPLDVAPIVSATFGMGGNNQPFVVNKPSYAVRRLTPLECERLMGFPDGWTDIPGASDTARYKALGNSIAIPSLDYIFQSMSEVLREGRA